MSEFDYEAIKTELTMLAQDEDEAGFLDYAKSVRHYIAAIEALQIAAIKALQAEAELGAKIEKKIEKLTNQEYMVEFVDNVDTIRNPHPFACRIMRSRFEGQGYGDTPLQALDNAIDALGEIVE